MPITTNIVTVEAQVVPAPTPSVLQQSGAFVSVGGTTQATNTYVFYATNAAVQSALSSTGNFVEVGRMGNTFFAQTGPQGSTVGVYILELGVQGTVVNGIAALGTWLTNNPGLFYAFLTPASWDAFGSTFNTLGAQYSSDTGMTYFVATTTSSTYTAYAVSSKAFLLFAAAPAASGTEFGAAALFYQWIVNNPTAAFPAPPMAFRAVAGVTPWPVTSSTTTTTLLSAGVNIIFTGAEGGLNSTLLLFKGTTRDLNQAMFWYAVDWTLINAKMDLAAAVFNGTSMNPPLKYSQAGINYLLTVLKDLGTDGIKNGLFESATFAAVPFTTYTTENPSAYAAGSYAGFSCTMTWAGGFLTITFFLTATQFVPG